MRALRTLLIIAVILGGLFVAADRLAVGFAEGEAADRLRTSEGLEKTPEVSIKGFPFLTQVVGGELDEVQATITGLQASSQGESIVIDRLTADMEGVALSSGYSSATAARATGSALIAYSELLKAARSAEPVEPAGGVTAEVTKLSDGGNGKIKVEIEADIPVMGKQKVDVLGTVTVEGGDTVKVHADTLPSFGTALAEQEMRKIADFQQQITGLPDGIKLDTVQATAEGVEISVAGSQVRLVG
jgi:hypothetical protein